VRPSRALAVLISAVCLVSAFGVPPTSAPYTWKNVQIVGGGFVDGVIFHPTAHDVRYARTDMGGAYRWDARTSRWQPMLDWMPYKDMNLMGVESIAVDPSDARWVYLACGTYTNPSTPNGAILRSKDQGKTFERTDVPFKFGGNEDGRGNGERLAVDPADGRILYLGTRHDGLWRSEDQAATWTKVASFPDVTEALPPFSEVPGETRQQRYSRMPPRGDGIVFVHFVPPSQGMKKHEASSSIYVGVSLAGRANLFASHDAGKTWQPVPGEPMKLRPTRAAVSADGFLYVAYGSAPGPTRMIDGAVWKLNLKSGEWTDITPDHPVAGSKEFGYAGVSVDAQHPQTLIVSSFGRPWAAGGEDIFRSTDGGANWKAVFRLGAKGGGIYDYQLAPYVHRTGIHWLFDIEIDPLNSNHATFTTGYGGWETYDLTSMDAGLATHWSLIATGIEETVALQLDSPTQGASLLSAIGDYGGFVHNDLDHPAPEGSSEPPRFGNTTGIASAPLKPGVVVRVGTNAERKPNNIAYSMDGGKTWKPTENSPVWTPSQGNVAGAGYDRVPQVQAGTIAVSADGETWVWAPERMSAYITHDRGASWTMAKGLPETARVVADGVDSARFYAVDMAAMKLYVSTDHGDSFVDAPITFAGSPPISRTGGRGDRRGGQDRLYAAPGRSGDLWLPAFDGLYRGYAGTAVFSKIDGVGEIHAFGFGKEAPGGRYPALYLAGTIQGDPGIFRSTDEARTWVRINDDSHQWGLVLQIAGDPKRFGRVYVGTHGRGISYGDPK
jgi:photosystem II stability/assembly factor-like uncharacterized protein